ncbi:hypothetical protein U9M48_016902 [Paspalum notatum var. saurae]|uniref:Uncharacterized protein n=1 Tax=Paspalum notatum var. saurae TaxID=547442 RepID=A0AAQ3WNN2_PASNO
MPVPAPTPAAILAPPTHLLHPYPPPPPPPLSAQPPPPSLPLKPSARDANPSGAYTATPLRKWDPRRTWPRRGRTPDAIYTSGMTSSPHESSPRFLSAATVTEVTCSSPHLPEHRAQRLPIAQVSEHVITGLHSTQPPEIAEITRINKASMELKIAGMEDGYTAKYVRDKLLSEQDYTGSVKEKVPPRSSPHLPWSWLPVALCILQEVSNAYNDWLPWIALCSPCVDFPLSTAAWKQISSTGPACIEQTHMIFNIH